MPEAYISVFRPVGGNAKHWVLYLKDGNKSITYQVTGEHPDFKKNQDLTDPKDDPLFIENVLVGEIEATKLRGLRKVVREAHVDNETVHWCCQDYVLEILEALCQQCIIEEDDSYYERGVNRAKSRHFGPVI